MAIRTSLSTEIGALITDLASESAAKRDAAVARLSVIGIRAVERLLATADSASSQLARASALNALEQIGDPRALPTALRSVASRDEAVSTAAIALARVFLKGRDGAAVVDALTTIALDRERSHHVRVAAVRSLATLPRKTIAPLLATLAGDACAAIRAAARDWSAKPSRSIDTIQARSNDPVDSLSRIIEQPLDDPSAVRAAIVSAAAAAPIPLLLHVVERIREREASASASARMEWTTVRGVVHAALAKRGSRVALYDVRESLERGDGPLPIDFLATLEATGDRSCLEPLAAAYARSGAAGTPARDWWRSHLRDAFRAIVQRERLTRRHVVVRKIDAKWPAAAKELWAGQAGRAGRAGRAGKAG